jgi:hypothetical protein
MHLIRKRGKDFVLPLSSPCLKLRTHQPSNNLSASASVTLSKGDFSRYALLSVSLFARDLLERGAAAARWLSCLFAGLGGRFAGMIEWPPSRLAKQEEIRGDRLLNDGTTHRRFLRRPSSKYAPCGSKSDIFEDSFSEP